MDQHGGLLFRYGHVHPGRFGVEPYNCRRADCGRCCFCTCFFIYVLADLYTSLRTWLRLADRPARRRIGAMKALRGNDGEERAGQRESRLHHSLSPVFLPWSGRLVANNGPISCRRSGNTKERPKQKSNPLRSRLSHGPLMRAGRCGRPGHKAEANIDAFPSPNGGAGRTLPLCWRPETAMFRIGQHCCPNWWPIARAIS